MCPFSAAERTTVRDDLISALRHLIVNDLFVEIPEEEIGLDDGLQSVVGLDSVGFVELRVLCERRFNVEINDDDFTPANFSSLRRLSQFVDRLQSSRKAAGTTTI
jgi:acyl carrier protein